MRPSVPTIRWRAIALANASDRRRRHLQRRQSRALNRLTIDPFRDLPEAEFLKTFRLGKSLVRDLIRELGPHVARPRRCDGISPESKVLIALAFYASGSYQTLIGQNYFHNVSQTTVSRSVRQVTEALNIPEVYANHIKWPIQRQERNEIKARFYHFGIPGVIGCIDGTHVAILRPTSHEERYYNRKGFHSLNVMVICDADLNILCVDASSPGSTHDSMVWQSHPLSRHLAELSNAGEQLFLLGDSGYPLRTTMMTPILNTTEGTPQHHYYQMHVTARNTVERCIGLLKARFRCLLAARALHYDPITAGKIVNACSILHNIANRNRVPVIPLTAEEAEAENQQQHLVESQLQSELESSLDTQSQRNRRVNPELQRGRELQEALVDRLWRER